MAASPAELDHIVARPAVSCVSWIQRQMGLMRNVNKLELRIGSGSGPWHRTIEDGKPVDIWGWDEVPARPVQYVAYAIEEDGKYYYQVGEKILEITEREYEAVRRNPNLYYFSTACKLHYRTGLENKGTRLQDLPRKECCLLRTSSCPRPP